MRRFASEDKFIGKHIPWDSDTQKLNVDNSQDFKFTRVDPGIQEIKQLIKGWEVNDESVFIASSAEINFKAKDKIIVEADASYIQNVKTIYRGTSLGGNRFANNNHKRFLMVLG